MKKKKKIGITFGAFDLCHAGHMLMFKEAKSVCDYLIVGLHIDPSSEREHKNKPIMSFKERLIILQGIKYIDEILLYQTEAELLRILEEKKPDIRIIGKDWKGKPFTGYHLPMKVFYNSRSHKYSTSELRRRIVEYYLWLSD
jgi:glycerol-3-phosphate cytidylyltransferase